MITRKKIYIDVDQLETKFAKDNNIKVAGLYQVEVLTEEDKVNRIELLSTKPNHRTMELHKVDLRTIFANNEGGDVITEVDEIKANEVVITEVVKPKRTRKSR